MKKYLLLLFLLSSNFTIAQRKLVYPIILVHGWTGSYKTWDVLTQRLENELGLTVERAYLNYNLNFDNNLYTSNLVNDVVEFPNSIGNNDVYIVNFDNGYKSNQSAAAKQGYALKLAIAKVMRATGSDKVVLLGHSMGGLAIREYLQNTSNWQPDYRHHIAKVATIGTPHGGSNFSAWNLGIVAGYDENSEAVRDLRTNYEFSGCVQNGKNIPCPGVYLFGGQETRSWMKTNASGSNFYNIDINCNGYVGENIIGLNYKPISTDLDFSCVIGGPNNSDVIVPVTSQNLNNYYSTLGAELFYFDCKLDAYCHTNEPSQAFIEMLQALDEPKKILPYIQFGSKYRGILTKQANGNLIDTDEYIINVPQRGIIYMTASNSSLANGIISIKNQNGVILNQTIGAGFSASIPINNIGDYTISVTGNSNGLATTYGFSFTFCSIPTSAIVTASGSTSFCDNQSVTLTATAGYDGYKWFKDGNQIVGNSNQITTNQSGNYSFQGLKCNVTVPSTNTLSITVKPSPIKPIITKDDQPNQFLLTSSSSDNNQWLFNGVIISGATNQTYVPQDLGSYSVRITKDGCTNTSDVSIVKMDKPTLNLIGSNPICDGDSLKLSAPTGFGKYIFSDGTKQTITDKNDIFTKKGGSYSVVTQRGKFASVSSDIIIIKVNTKPLKPTITFQNNSLKSSSPSNNQWYANNTILKDSTYQFLRNVGAGTYTVRVTENSCFTESDPVIITATEQNENDLYIKLYPNPNQGYFWVELPTYIKSWHVNIYDSRGVQIFTKAHLDISNNKDEIKISKTSGSYILQIITPKSVQNIKFVIE